ncbi:hypothetical protein IIB79_08000, partial [candidate division KSB1 bacterium]|nr:hypothetical protein [candidate division KSB1 bacterium]
MHLNTFSISARCARNGMLGVVVSTAVPGVAIPLLQDDCVNTAVDLDWVWDIIHLTSDDKTYRLDLDYLKRRVQAWFA